MLRKEITIHRDYGKYIASGEGIIIKQSRVQQKGLRPPKNKVNTYAQFVPLQPSSMQHIQMHMHVMISQMYDLSLLYYHDIVIKLNE